MIAGVMSGLCHYFGANDPLPWRILLVILAIFSFMTVSVVYLALWAIVPEAVTPEERLQLHGQPVNPTTLNEEIMRAADKAQQFVNSPRVQNSAAVLKQMLKDGVISKAEYQKLRKGKA